MLRKTLRKLVLAVSLFTASFSAGAREFTDIYYTLGETGWGAMLVQSESFIGLAFFIFDQNGNPIWYSCQLTLNQSGNYTGTLYASTGTYFALQWDASAAHITPLGTCSFAPIDTYHGTLTYSLTGGPTVVKPIQRYTLLPYNLAGNYSGSMAGSISGCQDPTSNDPAFRARYALAVTQDGDQSAGLTFTLVDTNHSGIVCTVSGALTHYGRLYQLNGVSNCTGPGLATGNNPASIDGFHPTGQGIEGYWTGSVGDGCTVSFHFSAVQNVNN